MEGTARLEYFAGQEKSGTLHILKRKSNAKRDGYGRVLFMGISRGQASFGKRIGE